MKSVSPKAFIHEATKYRDISLMPDISMGPNATMDLLSFRRRCRMVMRTNALMWRNAKGIGKMSKMNKAGK